MIWIENTHGGGENKPKRIIVHAIAEFLKDNSYAPYFIESIGLSAHAYITPSGVTIRSRSDNEVAYHAKGHNQDTLGVELLIPGEHDYGSFLEAIKNNYVTSEQYRALLILVRDNWMREYGITKVLRHSDIDPDRKKDPGAGFPWEDFKKDIAL